MNLQDMLERDEGRVSDAYPDPLTGGAPWTIGVGHTGPEVCEGLSWTDDQIDAALAADIAKAEDGCRRHLSWFDSLSEPRQAVLTAMAFQMGIAGLLAFTNTLNAVGAGRYAAAAQGMLESRWAKQTPKRAMRMAAQMELGRWTP
jgi:lysozyme